MIVCRTTALSVVMLAALVGTVVNGLPAQATPPVTKAPWRLVVAERRPQWTSMPPASPSTCYGMVATPLTPLSRRRPRSG
jgi:hypothetical protein